MKAYKKRALEIYNSGVLRPTDIAKIIIEEGLAKKGVRSVRNNISNWIKNISTDSSKPKKVSKPKEVDADHVTDKPFVLSAWNDEGYMMDIEQYCDHYLLPRHDIKKYKLVSHTGTPFYNIEFYSNEIVEEVDLLKSIDVLLKDIPKVTLAKKPNVLVTDRLIYTDVHVGMDASRSGLAQYSAEWNKDELFKRVRFMVDKAVKNKTSKNIVVDELGDYMDGYNGQTTRGGHALPQNMTNEQSFDNGLTAKMMVAKELSKHWDHVTFNNICEDNHAGSFGYIVNSAFKSLCEVSFDNVEVVNHQKFMNHYFIGSHCHVISHGKDSRNLKFGFKPMLDPKQIEKIDQYLKNENIYAKAEYIEFTKGDSHQYLMDCCTSDDFDYFNVMAFSPSSEWVQTNFKRGRSGFVIQSIDNNSKEKTTTPYWF